MSGGYAATPMSSRNCRKCGVTKPESEFYVRKAGTPSYGSYCRACARAAAKQWRLNNPVLDLAKRKAYYTANSIHLKKKARERYQKNKGTPRGVAMLEAARAYRQENSHHYKALLKAWDSKNKDRRRENFRRWRIKNPEIIKMYSAKRRGLFTRARGGCTAEQLKARFDFYGGKCAYCGRDGDLAADHVIALERGGTNFPANFRPACKSCNSSKGAKSLWKWRPEMFTKSIAV